MKIYSTLFVLFAILAVLVRAGDDRIDVQEAQYNYNEKVDALFNLARGTSQSNINSLIDNLMTTFCPEGVFKYWVANDANDGAAVTSLAAVRASYSFLSQNIFNNFSFHQVSNPRVKFITGTQAKAFTKLITWVEIKAPFPLPGLPANTPSFRPAFGKYQNEFVKYQGEWCMSVFNSSTIHQGIMPYEHAADFAYPIDSFP